MNKFYTFETEMVLPGNIEEVFEFFKSAENLQKLTPPWLDFKILTPMPFTIEEGKQIDYKLQLWGIPFRWKTEITAWQPPFKFQDVQLSGPYKKWVHTHSFRQVEDGTLMRDCVQYIPRGWILSPVVNHFFVARNVRKIFEYRSHRIQQLFGREAAV